MNRIREGFWSVVAWFVIHPTVRAWLLAKAKQRPYTHLGNFAATPPDIYMYRWWLFNPYAAAGDSKSHFKRRGIWDWLPSIRIHEIAREDREPHLHNHPWDSRTIILSGGYHEVRRHQATCGCCYDRRPHVRIIGDTAIIRHTDYHEITEVWGAGGVCITLFITWRKRGSWGFMLDDGTHKPWREYLKMTDRDEGL